MGEDGRAVAFHVCSLNLMPGLALGTIDASVALLTSTCERTGRSGRQLNNGPGPEVPSDLLGAQVAKHEAREDRVDPGSEANK